MTPTEAKQEVDALYGATRDSVGGEWNEAGRSWEFCPLPDGSDGNAYRFFAQRREQPLTDPESVAEAVRLVWAQHGHDVKVEFDGTLTPKRYILSDPAWLAGTGKDGLLFQFTVGENYADFSGDSRCVQGDPDDALAE
ncbi:hypothetical protein [Leifsonia poae]|uniref:hypothetical protein n=1 Tax=Leifsonia poae TaxID=110933 RepID=UPI003D675CC2